MEEQNPPFQLKNIYSPNFLQQVADEIRTVHPVFPTSHFLALVFDENWQNLELKQRIRHISHCLRACLPDKFQAATHVLTRTVQNMIDRDGERMTFEWTIFPDFVECFGTQDPDVAFPALEILTQLASAEFAIRPFLIKYPERARQQMLLWSEHHSPLVRRLASEGLRPRLPWGMGVPILKLDPNPALPILDRLKNDPAETVRRSVANHLNDISKDHPDWVLALASRWIGISKETDWVVKHACRGLLKRGNPTALALFGFEQGAKGIEISEWQCNTVVAIGGVLTFSFLIKNAAAFSQKIRLEYAIDFLTSTGNTSRKVFKIKELEYLPGFEEQIARRQRFQNFTTRKHFEGRHRIEILANGVPLVEYFFDVILK